MSGTPHLLASAAHNAELTPHNTTSCVIYLFIFKSFIFLGFQGFIFPLKLVPSPHPPRGCVIFMYFSFLLVFFCDHVSQIANCPVPCRAVSFLYLYVCEACDDGKGDGYTSIPVFLYLYSNTYISISLCIYRYFYHFIYMYISVLYFYTYTSIILFLCLYTFIYIYIFTYLHFYIFT